MPNPAAPTPAPTPSYAAGATFCADFARLSAERAAIAAELAAAVAPLEAAADRKLAPIDARLAAIAAKVEPWWTAHGAQLTRGKAKSAELAGCLIGTRAQAAKLLFEGSDDEAAAKAGVAALLRRRLVSLLSRKVSLDRRAIAARLKAEPGGDLLDLGFTMSTSADTFFIEPAGRTGRKG